MTFFSSSGRRDSLPTGRRGSGLVGFLLGLALLFVALGVARPAAAQFRDVGYTLEPTVQGILDSENASLQDEPLYGGALGLSFGQYLQISAEYLATNGATTSFTDVDRLSGLLDRNLDVRRYGTRLRINLLDRRVVPYLTAGVGVLQLDPEAVDATETIYGLGGGGFTFRLQDRFRLSVGGEILSYRYDPVATYLGPSGASNFETGTELVRTPAVTTSLSLFLGGRSLDERTAVDEALRDQFGGGGFLQNTRLFVNPLYGRIEFNDALGFPKDQNVFGLHAGVDLGPYVGLRGFYWRGTSGEGFGDDLAGGFEDIQMYGSELQFRLNLDLGRGFVPYARLGGGYLDVQSDYANDLPEGAIIPESRFFGITGAGLEVPVTRSLKLSGGVRGLLMSNPNVVEAGDPGTIYGSAMYSAGVEFRLGGGSDRPPAQPDPAVSPPTEPAPTPVPQEQPTAAPPSPDRVAADTTRAEPASLTDFERRLLARVGALERALQADTTQGATPPRSNVTDRTMNVPVPEEGEIYVRFGGDRPAARPGRADTTARSRAGAPSLTEEQVRRRVETALRQQLRQRQAADSAQADVEQVVDQALRDALRRQQETTTQQDGQTQQIQQLQRQIEQLRRELRAQQAEPSDDRRPARADDAPQGVPFYQSAFDRPLTYIVPVVGYRGGDGTSQLQIGVRGDYRTQPSSKFHLMPELTFGVGGGQISPNLLVNAAYSFLRDRAPAFTGVPLQPYAGAGIGIASNGGFTFEPVLNTMLGADYRVRGRQAVFLEYSTLDLGDAHRIHFGYRVRF